MSNKVDVQQEELDFPYDRETIFSDAQDQVELRDENLLICQQRLLAFELARKEVRTPQSVGIEIC